MFFQPFVAGFGACFLLFAGIDRRQGPFSLHVVSLPVSVFHCYPSCLEGRRCWGWRNVLPALRVDAAGGGGACFSCDLLRVGIAGDGGTRFSRDLLPRGGAESASATIPPPGGCGRQLRYGLPPRGCRGRLRWMEGFGVPNQPASKQASQQAGKPTDRPTNRPTDQPTNRHQGTPLF